MRGRIPRPVERIEFDLKRPATTAEATLRVLPRLLGDASAYAKDCAIGMGALAVDELDDYYALYTRSASKTTALAEQTAIELAHKAGVKILGFFIDAKLKPSMQPDCAHPTLHTVPGAQAAKGAAAAEVVDANFTVVSRLRGTFVHQVMSSVELDLVHQETNNYEERACIIEDKHYSRLAESMNMERLLQGDPRATVQPMPLPTATEVRLAWQTSRLAF